MILRLLKRRTLIKDQSKLINGQSKYITHQMMRMVAKSVLTPSI